MTKCDYETVEDAVLLTRQSERDHRRRHNYFSERQSLEKEPEAVQDSLKKTEAEKQDSTPESHQYGTIHADGFDRMLTPPERRRYHPYEEVKLDKGKDKYQSTSNTNVSGRTSPALSDTTSGSESPLLSRRSVPVNVTPTSTARRQKLSIGSLVTQRSLDTDDSGDEMKKKNTRKRVPSQGQLAVIVYGCMCGHICGCMPLLCATVVCRCCMPLLCATVVCHCCMPLLYATVVCHCCNSVVKGGFVIQST